ncbi:hypothetical protein CBR_g12110 [Chara braunii]|uniref:DUF659 domain-containing protein n=1 Tax=Chara braunii TaxID=69332 RepID=A0A388KR81_CHABU|nr:hypothetical protein CBR_g12110 [Chara braunii]|eukprot:GBG72539.1 hypothetical protein CBR_g12110 [Chara braunii]
MAMDDMYGGEGGVLPDEPVKQTQVPATDQGRGDANDRVEELPVHTRDSNDGRDRLRSLVGMTAPAVGGGATTTPGRQVASTNVALKARQSTLDPFIGNKVQKDLDRLLALAMYRGGVSFNWMRLKETQDYWDYIVTLLRASIVPVPQLLTYEGLRTRMLHIIYHEVATLIAPKKAKRADTGCTDKTGVSLADIWESVIRDDIGVHNVNAICTNNVEVMKAAADVLHSHPDHAIARIPWIPCAAHCLSLLLRDIAAQPWARLVMTRSHKMVKFMRNKQRALALHRGTEHALDLRRRADTRFRTAFMMFERLWAQRFVLDEVVSSDNWRPARWAGDARTEEPEVRRLCRSDSWWQQVKRVMDAMEPCYNFLKDMDRDGSSPPSSWDLQSILERKIDALHLEERERVAIMEIVEDRCAMMCQPAHAATYLLDPRRRDERASTGVMGGVDRGSSHATQGGRRSLLLTSRVPLTSPTSIPPRPGPGAIHSPHSSTLSGGFSLPTSVRPSSSTTICTAMRSPLGMPPLSARRPSAIRDNVKTSRVGRKKRQSEDDGGEDPPPARPKAGTGRARGRSRGSGRRRGKQQQSWALSALGDAHAETTDLAEGIAAGGGVSGGIRTKSRAAGRERQKTSSRMVDDDPDGDDHGNTSDEMSDSDCADETRQRGQAEGGDDVMTTLMALATWQIRGMWCCRVHSSACMGSCGIVGLERWMQCAFVK